VWQTLAPAVAIKPEKFHVISDKHVGAQSFGIWQFCNGWCLQCAHRRDQTRFAGVRACAYGTSATRRDTGLVNQSPSRLLQAPLLPSLGLLVHPGGHSVAPCGPLSPEKPSKLRPTRRGRKNKARKKRSLLRKTRVL